MEDSAKFDDMVNHIIIDEHFQMPDFDCENYEEFNENETSNQPDKFIGNDSSGDKLHQNDCEDLTSNGNTILVSSDLQQKYFSNEKDVNELKKLLERWNISEILQYFICK